MKSIAIVGEFGTGKTTLADYLVNHYGYTRISFAARLKELAAQVFNNGQPIEKNEDYMVTDSKTGLPVFLSGRTILQQLGQSVKTLDRDFWVRWLESDLKAGRYGEGPFVSDDCRFPYEADMLKSMGFDIVRIFVPLETRLIRYHQTYGRYPTADEMSHPSETSVDDIQFDYWVSGERPVEHLAEVVTSATFRV